MRFDGCLATSSRLIDRAVASVFDERLRPLGLRSTQVTLLAAVAGFDGSPTASDLTGPLQIDQTTLSRNLGRLADLGLIEQAAGEDGRAALLSLTAAGRSVLKKAVGPWEAAQAEIGELLGGQLSQALRKAAGRLSR